MIIKKAYTLTKCKPACTTTLETAKEARSTIIHDKTRHKATEPASCKFLITQSLVLDLLHARRVSPIVLAHKSAQSARYPDLLTSFAPSVRKSASHLITSQKAAFTLAEVLITLAVIGIVAVLTIPGLIKNHNEKAWSTAQDVFTKRLEVATRQMNTEEKLAGYSSTMDFVNELKKYIKITRVCDNSEITKCFNKQVIWNEGEEPVDMSTIKNAASLGQEDWDTDTVAVQFANGVNAIIAYNPNTTQDPYNNQFSATSNSMAILYDVSGNKNPNTNGKDINHINVTELAGVTGCMIPEETLGYCITQILGPDTGYSPMTKAECEQARANGEYKITECSYDYNYWLGAVRVCKGWDKMPTQQELATLAKYIYDTENINSGGHTYNIVRNNEKAQPFIAVTSSDNGYFYILSDDYDDGFGFAWTFNNSQTGFASIGHTSKDPNYAKGGLAVCVE